MSVKYDMQWRTSEKLFESYKTNFLSSGKDKQNFGTFFSSTEVSNIMTRILPPNNALWKTMNVIERRAYQTCIVLLIFVTGNCFKKPGKIFRPRLQSLKSFVSLFRYRKSTLLPKIPRSGFLTRRETNDWAWLLTGLFQAFSSFSPTTNSWWPTCTLFVMLIEWKLISVAHTWRQKSINAAYWLFWISSQREK